MKHQTANSNPLDTLIVECDRALRAIVGVSPMRRSVPIPEQTNTALEPLTDDEKKHAAGLMRVNHVGEVCAQALYQSQKLTSRDPAIRDKLHHAAIEEEDHLAWCAKRLEDLGSRPSLLNPLWYAGSFAIGTIAGLAGDKWSLGFVAETEHQVEKHLDSHLDQLPPGDLESRVIVKQMRDDEVAHGQMARDEGGQALPEPIQKLMAGVAKIMTKTAYKL